MREKIAELLSQVNSFDSINHDDIEAFRIEYLSKKGKISSLFSYFKDVPNDQKKEIGQLLNELKQTALNKVNQLKEKISDTSSSQSTFDYFLPGYPFIPGSRHPISIVKNEICSIFKRMSYVVAEGPEIEDDWHVFSALNFPPNHPARDMQDTFFIETNPEILLRTHTSSVQIRAMEKSKPPFRIIMPGRVFRNEAISARSHCIFHQIEGLYIDENVSFADLKQSLLYFSKEFFGHDTQIRLRPSFFPFTEPSAEMDISCRICKGKGCNVCKYTGWLEIMGCGMVDPAVLENMNIDPQKYTGFAFGMGIERIAMLKFEIKDIRLFFENDVRFLSQFTANL
ncbi:MAG: phenylalanine--tRNA ligase subunit alpha [Bacteroidales bacterium]|nr:phenylalanine--tRNA ligase subunit alpha [Bacteroidales bacterium]